eukprot:1150195-Pelagomonas_calceolata.AAC.4
MEQKDSVLGQDHVKILHFMSFSHMGPAGRKACGLPAYESIWEAKLSYKMHCASAVPLNTVQ